MIRNIAAALLIAMTVVAATFFALTEDDLFSVDSHEAQTRRWISELPSQADGRIDPLPNIQSAPPLPFAGGIGKRDPFNPR